MIKNNSKFPFGLDISDNNLRLIQLSKSNKKIHIQSLSKYNLPSGIIDNGIIINRQKLINCINDILAHPIYGSITTDEVVTCLPETKTFIKLISVEKTPNYLPDIVEHEIEKYIPIQLSDIYYDWQIINNHSNYYEVLIGAAPKNIVDSYQSVLSEANLFVNSFEIEPISICRCLLKEESNKNIQSNNNYAIIDIGKQRTSFVIYSKKSIIMSISVPISGNQVTSQIATILKINEKKAEKAKVVCGLDDKKANGVVKKILNEMIDNLNKRIADAINFYYSNYPKHGKIDEIIVTGGGSNIKDINRMIEKSHLIPVKSANSFTNLSIDNETFSKELSKEHKNEGKLFLEKNYSSCYTTAIGLALKNIFNEK